MMEWVYGMSRGIHLGPASFLNEAPLCYVDFQSTRVSHNPRHKVSKHKGPNSFCSLLSLYSLRNGQVPNCWVLSIGWVLVLEAIGPGSFIIPGWITIHDLKTIERMVDLGMYFSVAV